MKKQFLDDVWQAVLAPSNEALVIHYTSPYGVDGSFANSLKKPEKSIPKLLSLGIFAMQPVKVNPDHYEWMIMSLTGQRHYYRYERKQFEKRRDSFEKALLDYRATK